MDILKNKLFIVLVVCGIGIVSVWYWYWNLRTPLTRTISAGNIVITSFSPTQGTISGSFTVSTGLLYSDAIPSDGTGGACLVADLNRFNIPTIPTPGWKCKLNSECKPDKIKYPEWGGYCDVQGDGQCWVRPGPPMSEELCHKSKQYPPLGKIWAGTNPATKQPYIAPRLSEPIKWRVVACLNAIDPDTGKDNPSKGCGQLDGDGKLRMEVFGKFREVDYGPILE